ncbi:hypothetical protein CES85_1690 [Ochrobactrum quorumnocens]|uniref:Uncharacterized protein n=1 Tax=Ochrobactrum quorumnocens TaxID=271865 RepID=A0A248UEH3_9HYPH|nr:hypothetical protein CES85_1690 [[Ochrobactrum] quorumnocens]
MNAKPSSRSYRIQLGKHRYTPLQKNMRKNIIKQALGKKD